MRVCITKHYKCESKNLPITFIRKTPSITKPITGINSGQININNKSNSHKIPSIKAFFVYLSIRIASLWSIILS
nr:MAG TPA: hypothetical protein [Caudoviricetes sp.]